MHRAAEALGCARAFAEQLGDDFLGPHPLRVRVGVLAVGGEDVVIRAQRRDRSDRHGFLPDVQVQESSELAHRVRLGQRLFHAPDRQHLAVVLEQLTFLDTACLFARFHDLPFDGAHIGRTLLLDISGGQFPGRARRYNRVCHPPSINPNQQPMG